MSHTGLASLPRKGSKSTDDLIYQHKKKKKDKQRKHAATEERKPHRFTGRPRGFVRGKVKALLTSSDSHALTVGNLDLDDSSSSSASDEEAKLKPEIENPDGPTPAPFFPQISEDHEHGTEPIPRPKRTNRRRFSTEGRLQGTFLMSDENVTTRTRPSRSGSTSRPKASDTLEGQSDRSDNHISFTLRPNRDRAQKEKAKEEKRRRKEFKKLETDQSNHPIALAVGRVLFPFEIAYQVSASKAYPPAYHWLTRIDDVLLVGGIIFKREVKNLVKYQNLGGVINMCEEWKGPVKEYQKYGVENLYMPTCDPVHVSLSNLIKGVEFIEKIASQGRCVVVHCKAGRGRSSSVAICYYIKTKGFTAKEANEFLWQKREFTHTYLWKRPGIQEFEKEFRGKGLIQGDIESAKGKEKEDEHKRGDETIPSRPPAKWRFSEKGSTLKRGAEIGTEKASKRKSTDSDKSDSASSGKDKGSDGSDGGFKRTKKKKKKEKEAEDDENDPLPRSKSHTVGAPKKPRKGHRRGSSVQGRLEQTGGRHRADSTPVPSFSNTSLDSLDLYNEGVDGRKKQMKEKRKKNKQAFAKAPTENGHSSSASEKKEKKEKKDKNQVKEPEEVEIDDRREADESKEKSKGGKNENEKEKEKEKEQVPDEEKKDKQKDLEKAEDTGIPKTFSRIKRPSPTATQKDVQAGSQRGLKPVVTND